MAGWERITRKGIWVLRHVEALEQQGVPTGVAWERVIADAREFEAIGELDPDDAGWTEPIDGAAP